jgi:predicted metal-binding membrane protein
VGCAVPMSPKIICSSSTHWRTAFNMVGASWVGLGWVGLGCCWALVQGDDVAGVVDDLYDPN